MSSHSEPDPSSFEGAPVPGHPRPTDPSCGLEEGVCLVAVDGSDASVPALVWALRHAAGHAMRVEVLTIWPPHGSPLIHEVPGHFCAPRWSAHVAQHDVVRHALEEVPAGPILRVRLENGDAAEKIVEASARCDVVVLGSNSPAGRRRLAARIHAEAACEVVVVDHRGDVSPERLRPASPEPVASRRPEPGASNVPQPASAAKAS